MFFWYSLAEEPEIKLPTDAEYIMRNAGLAEAQPESRLLGEISITSDVQMTLLLCLKMKKN